MAFMRSYYPNYYSIEDIMATQEPITCTTKVPLLKIGFLVPGNDKDEISKDTSLELPFWLAQKLLKRQQPIVDIQVPKVFNERSRGIFEADAKVVNLHRVSPYFYEFGHNLACLNIKESEKIQQIIIQTFKERFRLLMDWADNSMVEPQRLAMLDVSERNLLKIGHRARMLLDAWLVQGVSQMKPADMVVTLRKRKLMEES